MKNVLMFVSLVMTCVLGAAQAVALDDFESYAVGTDIGTDAAWTVATGTMTVADDPLASGNNVLAVSGEDTRGYLNFAPIGETDDFVSFSYSVMWHNDGTGPVNDQVLGLSDQLDPTIDWNDYAPITRARSDTFDCRNGNAYEPLFDVEYDKWYDITLTLKQTAETYDIYVDGALVKVGAAYRQQGTNGDLVSFHLRDSIGVGMMYVDDVRWDRLIPIQFGVRPLIAVSYVC